MNTEKKKIREVLNHLINKRFSSTQFLIPYLKGHFKQSEIKANFVKHSDLIDEEDYRIDISIDNYVGSIWYLKTRQREFFITEAMLD